MRRSRLMPLAFQLFETADRRRFIIVHKDNTVKETLDALGRAPQIDLTARSRQTAFRRDIHQEECFLVERSRSTSVLRDVIEIRRNQPQTTGLLLTPTFFYYIYIYYYPARASSFLAVWRPTERAEEIRERARDIWKTCALYVLVTVALYTEANKHLLEYE